VRTKATTQYSGDINACSGVVVDYVRVFWRQTAWPQDLELIPKPFLAPKYVAPPDAPSNAVIAGPAERGDRLIVTGRALESGTANCSVSIYAFHADADGFYSRDGRQQRRERSIVCHIAHRCRGTLSVRDDSRRAVTGPGGSRPSRRDCNGLQTAFV
jgi:hypothetical protein